MTLIFYDLGSKPHNGALASNSLRNRVMHQSQIIRVAQAQLIVGAFGDVQKAYLAGYLYSLAIAVKILRPLGDWHQRVRIVTVSCYF